MAGNIRIIEPTENYQKVSKGIIFNREIDVLTLGVYVKVLCLGKEWDLNIQGLAKALNLSEAKIKKVFSLLERAGYVKRVHIKDETNGRFLGFDYHIGAVPFPEEERTDLVATHGRNDSNHPKIQRMENPTDGKSNGRKIQPMENREDIYRDNNKYRDIDLKIDTQKKTNGRFTPPSVEEVKAYCLERNNGLDPEEFVDFYTSKGWKIGKETMKDWKAAVRTWEKRRKDQMTPAAQPKRKTLKNID